jgi:hypothetical protein
MYRKEIEGVVKEFIKFKSNMGVRLTSKKVQYIWGKSVLKRISDDTLKLIERSSKKENSRVIEEKVDIAKRNLNMLLISKWVRFIGISGSVGAGFARDDDDIDLFIVVKDGSAWIYRGILSIKNIFNHVIRTKRDGKRVKDLFCLNYIVEERGLNLDSDMFNFHELMYLIPVYNEGYINYIYSKNEWLISDYFVNRDLLKHRERKNRRVNFLIRILNFFAYVAQILFMIISNHRPEVKRIFSNYKRGSIQFFPAGYKERVLKKLVPV